MTAFWIVVGIVGALASLALVLRLFIAVVFPPDKPSEP
jgi:hypothetical protein